MFRKCIQIFAVVVLLVATLASLPGGVAADPWHLADWQYRIKLTLNNSDTGGALSGHRVLINLNPNRVNYADFQSQGQDTRFTDAQGNLLAHHIAVWKASNYSDNSYIWVKVPTITNDNNTYIYMYYGNANAADGQNISGVWGNTYEGIWLFDDTKKIQRDYGEYANDTWGDFGTPWGLGFPGSYRTDVHMAPNRMWPSEAPYAVYSSDQQKTFVVYPDGEPNANNQSPFAPYITYYNHQTGAWCGDPFQCVPYKLGDAITGYDNHNAPVVVIDNNKYLHVFNGNHAEQIQHWKSTYPLNSPNWSLSAWTAKSNINFDATYIYAVKSSSGAIYVFGRNTKTNNPPQYHEPLSYVKSTNGGESWGSVMDLLDPGEPPEEGGYGTIYPTHFKYLTSPDERVHIVFHKTKNHEANQRYHGYVSFRLSDDCTLAIDGTNLGCASGGSPIVSQQELDNFDWFLDESSDQYMEVNGVVDLDESGHPHIFFMHRNDNWRVKWYKRNADNTAWVTPPPTLPAWYAADDTAYPVMIDVANSSDIDLWLSSWTGFSGSTPTTGHGELMLYHYNGSSWTRQEVYLGSAKPAADESKLSLGGTPVLNGQSGFQKVLLAVEGDYGPFSEFYGWGANGFAKYTTGNESYSPVGRAWRLYPTYKDALAVQHLAYSGNSNFTFSTNKICLEALVHRGGNPSVVTGQAPVE
jgi:hypothetical protein